MASRDPELEALRAELEVVKFCLAAAEKALAVRVLEPMPQGLEEAPPAEQEPAVPEVPQPNWAEEIEAQPEPNAEATLPHNGQQPEAVAAGEDAVPEPGAEPEEDSTPAPRIMVTSAPVHMEIRARHWKREPVENRHDLRRRMQEHHAREQWMWAEEWQRTQDWAWGNTVAQRIRFAPALREAGLFCWPMAMYLNVAGVTCAEPRFRCLIDTRPGAVSMAAWNLFANHAGVRRYPPGYFLHYPFLAKAETVTEQHGAVVASLMRKGRKLNLLMGLSFDWRRDLIVISLDDLTPYISGYGYRISAIQLRYEDIKGEQDFFWQTVWLFAHPNPAYGRAGQELDELNNHRLKLTEEEKQAKAQAARRL